MSFVGNVFLFRSRPRAGSASRNRRSHAKLSRSEWAEQVVGTKLIRGLARICPGSGLVCAQKSLSLIQRVKRSPNAEIDETITKNIFFKTILTIFFVFDRHFLDSNTNLWTREICILATKKLFLDTTKISLVQVRNASFDSNEPSFSECGGRTGHVASLSLACR